MSEYEVIQIEEGAWRIEDAGVRFFLFAGEERALLVDSGKTVENARQIVEGLTKLPVTLVNTHVDPDHTACNRQFDCAWMSPAEYALYRKGHGRRGATRPLWDGDWIDLGGRRFQVLLTPGHTPGSLSLLDPERRVLIGGDGVQNGRIFLFGPERDMNAYRDSLERLSRLRDRFDRVYPSHGDFPLPAGAVEELLCGTGRVLAGEIKPEPDDFMGTPIQVYDIGIARLLYDDGIRFLL